MEIKVLGTGCSSCKALYETTKQAISELGCDATLIKEEDLLKIMEYNILRLLMVKSYLPEKDYPYQK